MIKKQKKFLLVYTRVSAQKENQIDQNLSKGFTIPVASIPVATPAPTRQRACISTPGNSTHLCEKFEECEGRETTNCSLKSCCMYIHDPKSRMKRAETRWGTTEEDVLPSVPSPSAISSQAGISKSS